MTALNAVRDAVTPFVDMTTGAASVITAPISANRNTGKELQSFLKNEVGTITDGALIVPSTAVLYTLFTDDSEQGFLWRAGKGTGLGIIAYAAALFLRRGVM